MQVEKPTAVRTPKLATFNHQPATLLPARILALALGLTLFATCAPAATVLGPWVPLFRGIDHATGTNTAGGGGFPDLMVMHCLRVDLTDPGIILHASPRRTNWVSNGTETSGYTCTNFLKINNLQVAINANQFAVPGSSQLPPYDLPEGTNFNVNGTLFSGGLLVSPQDSADDAATLAFTSNNVATYYPTNWPAASSNGIHTAVSGPYNILDHGVNIGSNYIGNAANIHGLEPRTLYGLSQNKRYLFLMVIDGRQNGYSVGCYDWEAAEWLKLVGAWEGANLDGGGSTCMAVMDSAGKPFTLNRETASLSIGRQRTVGAQFGIYAQPLPGFFSNVVVAADDTTATVSWTTTSPATTQLKYGLTTNLTSLTASNSALTASHSALLTNLTPATGYYFAALASIGTTNYVSPTYYFVTTNYVTTNALFDLTNTWKYAATNLNGVNWIARTYNDTNWEGSGPGLLWTDNRGPNGNIPVPLNTEMPLNSGTGNPFTTYYFRTHFNFTGSPTGAVLQVQAYIDDGAVFYLNGKEIYRLRMAAAPTVISNSTLATGYGCSGDATCADFFTVSGSIISTNLLTGDNVIAAEVHNYNNGSADITFGMSAALTLPYTPSQTNVVKPVLNIIQSGNLITLSWDEADFTLQQADNPTGIWIKAAMPVTVSPFTITNSAGELFFRLKK